MTYKTKKFKPVQAYEDIFLYYVFSRHFLGKTHEKCELQTKLVVLVPEWLDQGQNKRSTPPKKQSQSKRRPYYGQRKAKAASFVHSQ